jgi:hypothetical protein
MKTAKAFVLMTVLSSVFVTCSKGDGGSGSDNSSSNGCYTCTITQTTTYTSGREPGTSVITQNLCDVTPEQKNNFVQSMTYSDVFDGGSISRTVTCD